MQKMGEHQKQYTIDNTFLLNMMTKWGGKTRKSLSFW